MARLELLEAVAVRVPSDVQACGLGGVWGRAGVTLLMSALVGTLHTATDVRDRSQ